MDGLIQGSQGRRGRAEWVSGAGEALLGGKGGWVLVSMGSSTY